MRRKTYIPVSWVIHNYHAAASGCVAVRKNEKGLLIFVTGVNNCHRCHL